MTTKWKELTRGGFKKEIWKSTRDGKVIFGSVYNDSEEILTWFSNGMYQVRGEHPYDLIPETEETGINQDIAEKAIDAIKFMHENMSTIEKMFGNSKPVPSHKTKTVWIGLDTSKSVGEGIDIYNT